MVEPYRKLGYEYCDEGTTEAVNSILNRMKYYKEKFSSQEASIIEQLHK